MAACRKLIDAGRRQFLKGSSAGALGVVATAVATQPGRQAQAAALVDYPSNRLANVSELSENEPLEVSYPDADSPGVLLKLGHAVEGGLGPDGDIVGFSILCPHKGFPAPLRHG